MRTERQVVESNFNGLMAAFIEPVVNNEASQYIASHLSEIRNQTRKMGVDQDKVDDLVSDVWLSIREAELNGNGYDISHSNDGDVITVEEFVYGRIKGYSMNNKYRSGIMERRLSKDSTKSIEIISASCSDASDLDSLDGFQKAFALASTYDDIDNVEAEISIRSNIEFCLGFDEQIGFKLINLLKNIDLFSQVGFNSSLFDKLKEAIAYHDEFGSAFKEVMSVAISSKPVFEAVVDSL